MKQNVSQTPNRLTHFCLYATWQNIETERGIYNTHIMWIVLFRSLQVSYIFI